jgi:phosphate transport system substrate-binding protein
MQQRFRAAAALGLLAAGIGLAASGCARNRNTVNLAGSTAFQPFAEKLAEDYMAKFPGANVVVQGGGSAVGIAAALYGTVQIGMADLLSLPPEAAELAAITVARDGIAIVVNPANPVAAVSTEQIKGLFTGAIRNWSELGGPDLPVTVVSREAGSGTRSSFEKILGGIQLSKDALIQDSNGTIRETVANDPAAVGYLSHGLLNAKIKALAVDGVQPELERIIAGDYKLVRPVFLLTKGEVAPPVRAFLDYALSAEGQATIQKNGLIPVIQVAIP